MRSNTQILALLASFRKIGCVTGPDFFPRAVPEDEKLERRRSSWQARLFRGLAGVVRPFVLACAVLKEVTRQQQKAKLKQQQPARLQGELCGTLTAILKAASEDVVQLCSEIR